MVSAGARLALAALSLWLATIPASAHELAGNRATLVLRDDNHLTVTLYLGLPELLFRTLARGKPFGAFLVQYSALDPATFQRELLRARSRIEHGTHLFLEDGRPLSLERWQWPEPSAVQAMLRERVMHETVGGGADSHGEPAEIRAEAVARHGIRSVSIQLPAELQQVLIVAYRPTQAWVAAGTRSTPIEF
jgi:hypothetical protein